MTKQAGSIGTALAFALGISALAVAGVQRQLPGKPCRCRRRRQRRGPRRQPARRVGATRTARTTSTGVNYWLWMPAFGDDVTGTDTQIASLKTTLMRVGGYNNDANTETRSTTPPSTRRWPTRARSGPSPSFRSRCWLTPAGSRPPPPPPPGWSPTPTSPRATASSISRSATSPTSTRPRGWWPIRRRRAIPGYAPADYCATATAYVAAMKAVDPTIKIVGPDLSWKYIAGNDWLTPILTGCGELFDIISIHRYPFEAAQASLAAAAADAANFRALITSVRGILQATGQGGKPLALTEMNIVYDSTFCVLDASPGTVGSALWLADGLGTAMDLGLWTSAVWDVSDDDGYALGLLGPAPAHTPRPAYYAYALYAAHFGPTLLTVSSAPAGVSAHASRNAADDATEIIVANWNSAPAPLAFSVTGLASAPAPRRSCCRRSRWPPWRSPTSARPPPGPTARRSALAPVARGACRLERPLRLRRARPTAEATLARAPGRSSARPAAPARPSSVRRSRRRVRRSPRWAPRSRAC